MVEVRRPIAVSPAPATNGTTTSPGSPPGQHQVRLRHIDQSAILKYVSPRELERFENAIFDTEKRVEEEMRAVEEDEERKERLARDEKALAAGYISGTGRGRGRGRGSRMMSGLGVHGRDDMSELGASRRGTPIRPRARPEKVFAGRGRGEGVGVGIGTPGSVRHPTVVIRVPRNEPKMRIDSSPAAPPRASLASETQPEPPPYPVLDAHAGPEYDEDGDVKDEEESAELHNALQELYPKGLPSNSHFARLQQSGHHPRSDLATHTSERMVIAENPPRGGLNEMEQSYYDEDAPQPARISKDDHYDDAPYSLLPGEHTYEDDYARNEENDENAVPEEEEKEEDEQHTSPLMRSSFIVGSALGVGDARSEPRQLRYVALSPTLRTPINDTESEEEEEDDAGVMMEGGRAAESFPTEGRPLIFERETHTDSKSQAPSSKQAQSQSQPHPSKHIRVPTPAREPSGNKSEDPLARPAKKQRISSTNGKSTLSNGRDLPASTTASSAKRQRTLAELGFGLKGPVTMDMENARRCNEGKTHPFRSSLSNAVPAKKQHTAQQDNDIDEDDAEDACSELARPTFPSLLRPPIEGEILTIPGTPCEPDDELEEDLNPDPNLDPNPDYEPEDEEEYVISAILSHARQDGQKYYLVQWEGYEATDWLAEDALGGAQEMVREYKEKVRSEKAVRRAESRSGTGKRGRGRGNRARPTRGR